ncbi:MAG TPA: YggT family protein [Pyrinomonadaceae bacterium]|nr:YggT family protein [Pyrinomonadaceae bacterium]
MILSRTLLFFTWAIQAIIGFVILLMVLRLIADAMDLNPFGWMSRTIRRLTDGLLIPVRGGLRNLGMDPKFAPLIAILLVILVGFFFLQLVETIFFTIAAVWESTLRGQVIAVLGFILNGLLSIYSLLILMRVIFSWGQVSYGNRVMRFLYDTTEPLLGPLRRMLPTLGWIDISPFVAFLIIWLFQAAIAGTLLRGAAMPAL